MWRAGLVGLLLCAVAPAHPALAQDRDAAAREVAEGEKLARAGLYAESIARFKAAERLAPRAAHDCLIALSYFRLEQLGQAHLFMQRCAVRASGDDPAPSWVVSMGNDVKAAIAAADLAAVTVAVRPAEAAAAARVGCSAFPPDESFAPAVFHLAAGEHTLRVEAAGFAPVEKEVAVAARQVMALELTLEPSGEPA
ncbi:MAG TPA: PEGA domain-containing protein, partial [Kofleriaceae bacterium]|nr:PEGA domain-containing protein [Kofleriaceae bacterium]